MVGDWKGSKMPSALAEEVTSFKASLRVSKKLQPRMVLIIGLRGWPRLALRKQAANRFDYPRLATTGPYASAVIAKAQLTHVPRERRVSPG